jgi:hypothetical protein
LIEVAVDGSGSNGIFASAVYVDEGLVAAVPIAAAQLMTTTTIATATIGQRRHC